MHAYISNGRWYLGGNNTQGDSRAEATCVATTAGRTSEFSWSQGGSAVDLGPETSAGSPRACFLTRMGGNFDSTTESVLISLGVDGHWRLGGSSNRTGVHARARCINVTTRLMQRMLAKVPGLPSDDDAMQVPLTDALDFDTQCMLTGVAGELSSDSVTDHQILILRDLDLHQLTFYIWTSSSRLQGHTMCVR
ncbi:hypothetical protein WMF30_01525 [Sorangium sp. So ce134]